jgi:hypothetical protein
MLEIDDAGWGCPVGGVLIGIYRRESEEFLTGIVSPAFFQGERFRGQAYLGKVQRIAKNLMACLKKGPRELVLVCPGPLFRQLRGTLFAERHNFQARTIDSELQILVERAFAQYLNGLGVPPELLAYFTRRHHGGRFHALLGWVAEEYPRRITYCKTGWASWPKWEKEILSRREILRQATENEDPP